MRKKSDPNDGLATNWDLPMATQQVIMSDQRNFSQPKEDFYSGNIPSGLATGGILDAAMADDDGGDPFIVQVQKFMQTSPLGISYGGKSNGFINQPLLNALMDLEVALQTKYAGQQFIGTIVNGLKINQNGFWKAVKLLSGKSSTPSFDKDQSSPIKDFQAFFGLPPTGAVDDQLIAAAKATEDKIATAVNDSSAHGLLWDDGSKSFKTTVADLQEALRKIKQFTDNKNS